MVPPSISTDVGALAGAAGRAKIRHDAGKGGIVAVAVGAKICHDAGKGGIVAGIVAVAVGGRVGSGGVPRVGMRVLETRWR